MVKTERSGNASAELCKTIYDCTQMGVQAATISNYYKMKSNTARRIAKRMLLRKNRHIQKKMGAPPKLSGTSLKRLEILVLKNSFMPAEQLCNLFNSTGFVTICTNTLRKYIKILGFCNYRAAQKPFIRVANLQKRIACATEHFFWSVYQWNRVIFTDESPFRVKPIKRCLNVWRRDGERHAAECVTPTFKSGFKTINDWSGFSFAARTPLVWIKGKFNHEVYHTILDSMLLPFAEQLDRDVK